MNYFSFFMHQICFNLSSNRKLQTFWRIADKYKRLPFCMIKSGENDMFALCFHPRSVTKKYVVFSICENCGGTKKKNNDRNL